MERILIKKRYGIGKKGKYRNNPYELSIKLVFDHFMIQPKEISEKHQLVNVIDNNVMPVVLFFFKKTEFLKIYNKVTQNLIKKGVGNK